MTKFNVPTKVIVPEELEIQLVRADHAEVSNVFRIQFEVSLALASMFGGALIAEENPTRLHYVCTFIFVVATIVLCVLAQ